MENRNEVESHVLLIDEIFEFCEKTFHGLNGLRDAVCNEYNLASMPENGPFVVCIKERYPCFDSSDYWYESRYYQTYYLLTDKQKAKRLLCQDKKDNSILPYIYYKGEGQRMEFFQRPVAPFNERIIVHRPQGEIKVDM
ncbi:MAG: hypothetical protein IJ756_07470 [Paludibacteraceae bacterium]|nr:hypothetical protein [Paludibacteraceae bacterium]